MPLACDKCGRQLQLPTDMGTAVTCEDCGRLVHAIAANKPSIPQASTGVTGEFGNIGAALFKSDEIQFGLHAAENAQPTPTPPEPPRQVITAEDLRPASMQSRGFTGEFGNMSELFTTDTGRTKDSASSHPGGPAQPAGPKPAGPVNARPFEDEEDTPRPRKRMTADMLIAPLPNQGDPQPDAADSSDTRPGKRFDTSTQTDLRVPSSLTGGGGSRSLLVPIIIGAVVLAIGGIVLVLALS